MIVDFYNDKLITQLSREKRQFKLALTSGCFDLLHSGHIHFLSEIARQVEPGTKILVAIHGDRDISRIKGTGRPIFLSEQRLVLLNSLRLVDYVGVWEDWESIPQLAYKLKPDYLAADENNIERANWKDNWRSVAEKISATLIPVTKVDPDISTTSFVNKIRLD